MTRAAQQSAHDVFFRSMLQAALGAVLVFSVADQNPMYLVLSTLAIAIVWVFSVRSNRPAPRQLINTILLVVVVIAGAEMLRMGVGVNAFAVFAVLLMGVKMLDLREPRDDGQVLVLTVAILVSAVLTSNSLMTGFLMVGEIILILRAVVFFQIHAVLHKSAPTSVSIGKRARVDIRSMVIATGFLCALLGSVIFVAFPRNIGLQAFGQWGNRGSVSGFSDTVELGRPGTISQSSAPVLNITVTNRDGQNIGKENSSAFYLRGAVLNTYESGHWTHSASKLVPLSNRAKLYPPNTMLKSAIRDEAANWDRQFAVTMRSSENGETYLFAPWKTVEFRVGSEPMHVGLDFERGLFLKDGIGGRVNYSVRSMSTLFDEVQIDPDAIRDPVSATLNPEPVDPAVSKLAWEIMREAGIEPDPDLRPISDDRGALSVIETHLRTQYSYSLDSQAVPRGEDATKWFLFTRQAGHCEYFASSLALMSRSVGIPARVITGYIASDFNTVTGQYIVRESNAHAWVEAQIAPGQWRTFDGTPPADFHAIHEPDPSIWRSIAKVYESVEFLWVRKIVGFDASSRQSIMGGSMPDLGIASVGESLLNRLAAGRGRLIARGGVIAGIVFSFSLFVGIILLQFRSLFAVLIQTVQSWSVHFRYRLIGRRSTMVDPKFEKLDRLLHRALRQLDIPKPECTPLKSHLIDQHGVLNTLNEPTREAIFNASALLYQFKFAPNPQSLSREHLSQIESCLRRSEKSMVRAQ